MRLLIAVPAAYRVALEELAAACREACALADVLDYAAGLLRGRPSDPEESPADLFATAGRLRQALGRLDRARWAARDAWVPPPRYSLSLPAAAGVGRGATEPAPTHPCGYTHRSSPW
jgi:hypothetical protein